VSETRTRVPWIVAAAAIPLFAFALYLTAVNGSFGRDTTFIVVAIVMILGYTTVGALIASRRVGGPIGWFMMCVGIGFVFSAASSEYAVYAFRTDPGGLPFATAAAWLNTILSLPTIIPLILVLLLFPTGTVPSPRWRVLPPIIVVLTAIGLVGTILRPGDLEIGEGIDVQNPTAVPAIDGAVALAQWMAAIGLIVAAVASVIALVLRYRRARGEERQQIRWLSYVAALGAAFFVIAGVSSIGLEANESSSLSDAMFYAFFFCLGVGVPAAAGVAVLRYRLWDLDLVVRKAVIFTLVAGSVTVALLVLALVVPVAAVGVGLSGWEWGLFVVGIALGTLVGALRRWARRIADRLVYGGRATPYEVLTEFSGRLAETYSTDDVAPRMAAIVGSGTGARAATIWLRVGREVHPLASWPQADVLTDEAASWFEVRHQGEALGAVTVSMPANDPMTPDKGRLVHDLAAQAGLVLRNVRLIEELRASRRRIVTAQDERARKLERDIHDGAQQQLVALAVKVRLADAVVERDPAKAHEMLAAVQAEAQDALETLRDLARGIYPPLLADKGLAAALAAQGAKAAVQVEVTADGAGRYDEDVEAAIYFCALEALQNAAKYAKASRVTIALAAGEGVLRFEVADDGVGFDPATVVRGTGLAGMTDRIEAIGGRLAITGAPGAGTRVGGSVRVPRSSRRADRAAQAPAPEPAAAHADSNRSGPNTAFGM